MTGIMDEDKIPPEEIRKEDEFRTMKLSGMYEEWFLDYASYVILERAVPDVVDGLKPVQRRILHSMKDLDDGRYNKVANIIGHTMKYHPHGDASIGDALVQLGQKDLLIDAQGNWGNILTGDSAAAPRYIEARLSKFALDVVFNPKITEWKPSYDGRNKEPVTLPVKFPLLLAQGVEGIAVGLSSKILPHNFNELIDASVNILHEKDFEILPDFPTGGLIDVSRYNNGERGGRVRVRARIRKEDKKTLVITEVPFGVTTSSLIDTIVAANDKRKIRIRKIDDNTAENVEIVVHLASGVSPDQTIDALYAFTNCELSISPNACVINEGTPQFLDVKQILKISTDNTLKLLRKDLEIRLGELQEHWHFSSLEKIFIEERIYRKIENCKTWESVIETIDEGLGPFKKLLPREVTRDDILRLTEIRIKRISKYNSDKAEEELMKITEEIEEVKNHLDHMVDFTINYFRQIKKKYGKGRERKTEIRNFDTIEATMVAAASEKLYINRSEGFAGFGLKRDEYVCDCSNIDDIIVFRADGTMMVTKVESKIYVGKDVLYIKVFKKGDDRTIYNMIYRDGRKGKVYVKRFPVVGVTRDKEYTLTAGTEGSRVLYFTANPNGEAEIVKVYLRPNPRLKKTTFEFDFSTLAIKGRNVKGNILCAKPVRQIIQREEGVSTLGARDIWYDDTVNRMNADERGKYLGAFKAEDKVLVIYKSGNYKLYGYDLSTHFDAEDQIYRIEKYDPDKILTLIYLDGESGFQYVKRFVVDETDKKVNLLTEHPGSRILEVMENQRPVVQISLADRKDGKPREDLVISLDEFIAVKGVKAKGKRLSDIEVTGYRVIDNEQAEEGSPVMEQGREAKDSIDGQDEIRKQKKDPAERQDEPREEREGREKKERKEKKESDTDPQRKRGRKKKNTAHDQARKETKEAEPGEKNKKNKEPDKGGPQITLEFDP